MIRSTFRTTVSKRRIVSPIPSRSTNSTAAIVAIARRAHCTRLTSVLVRHFARFAPAPHESFEGVVKHRAEGEKDRAENAQYGADDARAQAWPDVRVRRARAHRDGERKS